MNDYQRACELKEETIANRRYIHGARKWGWSFLRPEHM